MTGSCHPHRTDSASQNAFQQPPENRCGFQVEVERERRQTPVHSGLCPGEQTVLSVSSSLVDFLPVVKHMFVLQFEKLTENSQKLEGKVKTSQKYIFLFEVEFSVSMDASHLLFICLVLVPPTEAARTDAGKRFSLSTNCRIIVDALTTTIKPPLGCSDAECTCVIY